MRVEPVYRGILGIDIERFSRPEWTDPIRARLRSRIHRLVDDALARAQIDPTSTARSDTGDGLWLLAGAQVPTTRLLHPLATSLASGLVDDNQQVPGSERIRLRVVVHAGELLQDSHGHTGQSWNHAARLLNADATRAVLAANPGATVVLVTSARAWVHLPGLATQPKLPAVLALPSVGQAGLAAPREPPRPPGDFTGRAGELASLWELLGVGPPGAGAVVSLAAGPGGHSGRPVVICAIDGMGGIGRPILLKIDLNVKPLFSVSAGQRHHRGSGARPPQLRAPTSAPARGRGGPLPRNTGQLQQPRCVRRVSRTSGVKRECPAPPCRVRGGTGPIRA